MSDSEPQTGAPTASPADLVVLGAGSGGYACALRAAQLGLSVILIEKAKVGGTCLHEGCIPTKALLHAAEVAESARTAASFGVQATLDGIDMGAVHAYKDSVVQRLYKGLTGLVAGRGITVVEGTGRLTSPTTVVVGDISYTGRAVVIATGSTSRSLPGIDIDEERVLTSEHALRLPHVPSSAIVLGGGVIGCEFASVWRSFGAEVTVVEALPRLVASEDESSTKVLERAFRKRGIKVRTNSRFAALDTDDNGVHLTLDNGEVLTAQVLLVAVGRGPVTDGIGLDDVGVATDRGYVVVDDRLRTNVPGVFAVGDVVPGLQLAHRGFAHGIFVAETLAGLNPSPVLDAGIPRVTYCEPELASVGLTEAQARELHGDLVEVLTYDLGGNGKSQILRTQGAVKLVRTSDGPILGVHMVGARVGELVGEAQLIYNWEGYADDVARLIHAHPTQNEALGEAHMALAGQPLHAHS